MNKNNIENPDINLENVSSLKSRLDALVLISLKANFSGEDGKIKLSEAVPILYSAGYKPLEIAKLLGKKKTTDITYILYGKSKKRKIINK
jgi:hypothetical protein